MSTSLSPTTIVSFIVDYIDGFTKNFTKLVYQGLADYMQVPINLGATLLVCCIFFGVAMGHLKPDRKMMIVTILKVWFVMQMALHWDFFSNYFMNVLTGTTNDVEKAILTAVPVDVPGASSVNDALQVLFTDFYTAGQALLNKAGMSNIAAGIEGLLIWAAGIAFVGLGLFEMMLAKVGACVLFGIAPFVCIFFFAPFFKGVFDRWLGLLLGFMFFNILIIAVLTLCANMMFSMLDLINGQGVTADTTAQSIAFFCLLFVMVIGIFFIRKTEQIGMTLGGSVSIGTGTSFAVSTIAMASGYAIGQRDSNGEWSPGFAGKAYNGLKSMSGFNDTSILHKKGSGS